jgi:hypothetical protein
MRNKTKNYIILALFGLLVMVGFAARFANSKADVLEAKNVTLIEDLKKIKEDPRIKSMKEVENLKDEIQGRKQMIANMKVDLELEESELAKREDYMFCKEIQHNRIIKDEEVEE